MEEKQQKYLHFLAFLVLFTYLCGALRHKRQ